MKTQFAIGIGFALVLGACHRDEQCNGWSGVNGRSAWFGCGDKRDRKVECDVVPPPGQPAPPVGKPVTCRCSVGGVLGKTFEMENGRGTQQLAVMETATKTANEQCGWKVSR